MVLILFGDLGAMSTERLAAMLQRGPQRASLSTGASYPEVCWPTELATRPGELAATFRHSEAELGQASNPATAFVAIASL